MAFEGPLEDRLAIRERVEAYGDAVFRRDAEAWIANWAPDAVWSLPGLEVSGRDAVKAAWVQAMKAFELAAFFCVLGAVEVAGATAAARVYTQEILIDAHGGRRRIVGAYHDDLLRTEGVWLFRRRRYRILDDVTEGRAP